MGLPHQGDVDAAVALFSLDAVIDDPSTCHRFDGQVGVRTYGHFVDRRADVRPRLRIDFTGDFGHQIGLLDLTVDNHHRATRIDADLE